MIAVVQRVTSSSVTVNGEVVGKIGKGFNVLLGIADSDTEEDLLWIAKKILGMRIFGDQEGKMNLDLSDIGGEILVISQFTLLANSRKGNRPSFIEAARPEKAIPFYEKMIQLLSDGLGKPVEKGIFGADMKVSIENDGPVTVLLDSRQRR